MIHVTRLNGTKLVVNAEMIEFVESTPDTIISMNTGKKIIVRDSVDEVVSKIIEYQRESFPRFNEIHN